MLTARKAVIKPPQTAGPTLAETVSLATVKWFSSMRNSASGSKFSLILCHIRRCGSSAGCCCRAPGAVTASLTMGQLHLPQLLCDGGGDIGTGKLLVLPGASQAAPQTAATSRAGAKQGRGHSQGLLAHLGNLSKNC